MIVLLKVGLEFRQYIPLTCPPGGSVPFPLKVQCMNTASESFGEEPVHKYAPAPSLLTVLLANWQFSKTGEAGWPQKTPPPSHAELLSMRQFMKVGETNSEIKSPPPQPEASLRLIVQFV
jgi:hypothetical protein